MIRCVNFMDLEAIQEQVKEWEALWGAHDSPPRMIDERIMTDNCSRCDFGLYPINKIVQAVDPDNYIMSALRKATGGKPFQICYKAAPLKQY